jgi:hypothetical protein
MDALIGIYIGGFVLAFIINAGMFTLNSSNVTVSDIDLTDKVITTIMSLVGAIFSWLFIIVFVLSFKNSYIAKHLNNFFDNFSTSKL